MVSMSDELKERKILKLILIVRFACATLNVGYPLYWAITKYGGHPDFELALNRIGSHLVECHFDITRSTLKGDKRWEQFFAAQIKAVMLQKVMRRLHFPPYIWRFAMPAGSVVRPDTEKSIHLDFGNIIDGIKEMTYHRSQNRRQAAFEVVCPLMEKLVDLHRALIEGMFWERSHGSSPWLDGGMTTRCSRPADRELAPEEKRHLHNLASKCQVNSTPWSFSRCFCAHSELSAKRSDYKPFIIWVGEAETWSLEYLRSKAKLESCQLETKSTEYDN
jgi:hypothetical protein